MNVDIDIDGNATVPDYRLRHPDIEHEPEHLYAHLAASAGTVLEGGHVATLTRVGAAAPDGDAGHVDLDQPPDWPLIAVYKTFDGVDDDGEPQICHVDVDLSDMAKSKWVSVRLSPEAARLLWHRLGEALNPHYVGDVWPQ